MKEALFSIIAVALCALIAGTSLVVAFEPEKPRDYLPVHADRPVNTNSVGITAIVE